MDQVFQRGAAGGVEGGIIRNAKKWQFNITSFLVDKHREKKITVCNPNRFKHSDIYLYI